MWCDETVGPRQRDVIIHTTVVSIKRTIILFRHNNNVHPYIIITSDESQCDFILNE